MEASSMSSGDDMANLSQRALSSSQQLQALIADFNPQQQPGPNTVPADIRLAAVAQAHTSNVLANIGLIDLLSNGVITDPAARVELTEMRLAAENLSKSARRIHEHIIKMGVAADRLNLHMPPLYHNISGVQQAEPPPPESHYRQSAVEEPPSPRTYEREWNRRKQAEATRHGSGRPMFPTPKQRLNRGDVPTEQALPKRPRPNTENVQPDKRKSDVSMHDVDIDDNSAPPPAKRIRSDAFKASPQPTPIYHKEEYEDISEEVETRLQGRQARQEQERKKELGIVDKRKRQSGDSLVIDLTGDDSKAPVVEKRESKRKKIRHSDQVIND